MSSPTSSTRSASASTSAPVVAELASLRRRLASMLYESLLLLGVLALFFLVPYLIAGPLFDWSPSGELAWIHIFVVLGGYFSWYWRRHGQTLAMQTWRLKLVDAAHGTRLSAARCWLRYLLCWPSVLLFGFGLWWALIDRDRQFLHDRLAGSCVVLLPTAARAGD